VEKEIWSPVIGKEYSLKVFNDSTIYHAFYFGVQKGKYIFFSEYVARERFEDEVDTIFGYQSDIRSNFEEESSFVFNAFAFNAPQLNNSSKWGYEAEYILEKIKKYMKRSNL